ncbi:MAG: glycosyltransferase [Victivallales bacterium]|nr:glycosyltransferase [Victivallales bacterium]
MSFCEVGIVMLAHNGADFTRYALEGILSAETKPREMFLVDNCSADATPDLIQEFAPRFAAAGNAFTTWRNDENKGCSLARNEAWEKVKSQYMVFLDNDCVVCSKDWLRLFIDEFAAHPKLGVIGPKIIYPYQPHKIQCAGVSISRLGRVAFRGRGADRDDPRYQSYWNTWSLISACWMMRTDLRESVGYLDELFHPVQYEDLDLCVRARLEGFEVAYTPKVEMYHFEGITTASFGAEEYKVNIARNSLKFRERYHKLFKTFDPADELPAEEYRWLRHAELGLRMELDLTQK